MDFIRLILPLLAPWPLWGVRRSLAVQWKGMSMEQKNTLQWAYEYGLKHGLGESMRAICWQESSAGLNLENEEDGSYGRYGGKALIVATRLYKTWPDQPSEAMVHFVQRLLLTDHAFAAEHCVRELRYWQKKRGADQWTKVWASYNAGNSWWNGKGYAADIRAKINFLRKATKKGTADD